MQITNANYFLALLLSPESQVVGILILSEIGRKLHCKHGNFHATLVFVHFEHQEACANLSTHENNAHTLFIVTAPKFDMCKSYNPCIC